MANTIKQIDNDTLADLFEIVRMFRRGQLGASGVMSGATNHSKAPIFFHNDSGEVVPPYAVMQITGTVNEEQNYLLADKPADTDGTAGAFLVNGHREVPIDGDGVAQNEPVVRVFKTTGTATAGTKWRPTVNQWYMTLDTSGLWVAAGDDDIDDDVFKVFMPVGGGGDAILFATRTGGIAARSTTTYPHTFPSATVDLIDPVTGNVYSPNRTETVYNMTNIAITHVANRPRQAKKIGTRYFIDVDDC